VEPAPDYDPAASAAICALTMALLGWVPAAMLVVWIWPRHSARGWWLGLLAWLLLTAGAGSLGYLYERRARRTSLAASVRSNPAPDPRPMGEG
jgi:hypothetical protein